MDAVKKQRYAAAGTASVTGAVLMLIGAACWGATGTDLWAALAGNNMQEYMTSLSSVKTLLAVNTACWIAGVVFLGTATTLMSTLGNENHLFSSLAKIITSSAVPVAIVSFLLMFSLVIISPSIHEQSITLATVLGWTGARLDDIATLSIIGISPFLLSVAGRDRWVPGWLQVWGMLTAIAAVLVIISIFVPSLYRLNFIIIPVGIGWMIAAGIVLLRKK